MKPGVTTQNAEPESVAPGTNATGEDENMTELDEESLQELYAWIDEIPLSRPKRNITRDFADGVMAAEIVKHFIPKIVEIHNYTPANSMQQKISNWGTLNRKVFSKLSYNIPEQVVRGISACKPGVVEVVLDQLRKKVDMYLLTKKKPIAGGHHFGVSRPLPQISPDGYMNGQEVGSYRPGNDTDRSDRSDRFKGAGRPPRHHGGGGGGGNTSHRGVPVNPSYSNADNTGYNTGQIPRTRSLPHVNESQLSPEIRLLLEEKEQALLASQETVQILQAKVRRLEHLLHLKDIRIEDISKKLYQRDGHGYVS
ncbi:sperm flagellar protein 1-like [Saccoglossus kowalevskii]|uniref:Sperm flagellar protein 1-like n=1 Tax=Saccoglossus kowalevskii TaxID=10224 RepID=A0ABM0M8S2_SACKO|nr:PREDICTED: sperm flagellar protein 1-like [Saccoglossus kowalevskii]